MRKDRRDRGQEETEHTEVTTGLLIIKGKRKFYINKSP